MKCRTCGEEMIQKPRSRLVITGGLMIALIALVAVSPYWWAPGIILSLTGVYLIVWAIVGKGCWCRVCKKFSVFPNL